MKTNLSLPLVLLLFLLQTAHAQFTYTTNNGTITITGYTGTNDDVVIPSTIEGLLVTSIGTNAFESDLITSVTIGTERGQNSLFLVVGASSSDAPPHNPGKTPKGPLSPPDQGPIWSECKF